MELRMSGPFDGSTKLKLRNWQIPISTSFNLQTLANAERVRRFILFESRDFRARCINNKSFCCLVCRGNMLDEIFVAVNAE